MPRVLYRKNLLVMFKMTDSSDKLQIENSNLWRVRVLEVTMQTQQQYCTVDKYCQTAPWFSTANNAKSVFCCMRHFDFTNRDTLVATFACFKAEVKKTFPAFQVMRSN